MQLPIQLLNRRGRSLQDQLFDQIVELLVRGRLPAGARMPATRQLAHDLGVSRNTVVQTYERLAAEGFIEMRGPRGGFVTERAADLLVAQERQLPDHGAESIGREAVAPFGARLHATRSPYTGELRYDFWVGRPDARLFPVVAWRKLINDAMSELQSSDGSYGDPAGLLRLRTAIARHVGLARGISCSADDIIIINGSQEGINLVARLLVTAGQPVGMECPGYLGGANVLASFGARLIPVPVDEEGAQPGQLPPKCRLMYLTPAHQYPSGVALSAARRAEWLQWAQAHDGYLIEDDYDSDFYYDSVPPTAVKAMDESGRVIYLGTFSKCLAAGLRMGYMVVPPRLRRAAVTVKGLLTSGSPLLTQTALAGFLESEQFAHHLRRLRKVYAGRRDTVRATLLELFDSDTVRGGAAGMHLLWQLPAALPAAIDVERAARSVGVGIYSLESGNSWLGDPECRERSKRVVVLGYAALEEDEIRAGLSLLKQRLLVAAPVPSA